MKLKYEQLILEPYKSSNGSLKEKKKVIETSLSYKTHIFYSNIKDEYFGYFHKAGTVR